MRPHHKPPPDNMCDSALSKTGAGATKTTWTITMTGALIDVRHRDDVVGLQEMIAAIVDASYELARRRLMECRWRDATQAAVVGLTVETALSQYQTIRPSLRPNSSVQL